MSETSVVNDESGVAQRSELQPVVMRFDMIYCHGDDGRAYYVKGHVPIDEFKSELTLQVDNDDDILNQEISHCWMRVCRDFEAGHPILCEAEPNSRGAFRATWVQDA